MSSTEERESQMVGGAKGPSVAKVFAFIAFWPAVLPLVMMQTHCFPISALSSLPLFLGVAGGIIRTIRRLLIVSKNSYHVLQNGIEKKFHHCVR